MANLNKAFDYLLERTTVIPEICRYDEPDEIQLFFGESYALTSDITVIHPTLKSIKDLHYKRYLYYVGLLSQSSIDIADVLWFDQKIWYQDIESEWKFFIYKASLRPRFIEYKDILDVVVIDENYRDAINWFLNLTGDYAIQYQGDVVVLKNLVNEFEFTEEHYLKLYRYIRQINCVPKLTSDVACENFINAKGKIGAQYFLNFRYSQRQADANKPDSSITFASIVSSVFWRSGNTMKDFLDLPIYAVQDGFKRYSKFEEWNNTITALYNGCLDTKKNPIQWEKVNWASAYTK